MRIVYCIPQLYNSAGMERVLTQKANWLAAHTEHRLTIITTERAPQGWKEVYFPLDEKIQVVPFSIGFNEDYSKPLPLKWIGHMRRMRAYRRALEEYIVANKVDLCISLCGKEIAFLHELPCRTIAELHFAKDHRRQLLTASHSGAVWRLLGDIRTWQLVRAVSPLERLVVLTEQDKADWEKAGCTNVVCIPNICTMYDVRCTMYDVRCTMYKVQGTKTVLAVGRLHEQKGFDLLLRAWQALEQRQPGWTLRITGEGDRRAELEAQAKRMGLQRVQMPGRTDDMAKEYAEAALFVLSSRYEGMPLALMEAMWCGVPCVAFDCPQGAAALIGKDRGWLVPEGDTDALSRQLEYAMTHPEEAEQCAQRAQAYVRRTYSEEAVMPEWVKLIENG